MPGAADGYLMAAVQHRYKAVFGHPLNFFSHVPSRLSKSGVSARIAPGLAESSARSGFGS